jgi:hypothetical protein
MTLYDDRALPDGTMKIDIPQPVRTDAGTMVLPQYLLDAYEPLLHANRLFDQAWFRRATPFEFPPPLHQRLRRKITNKVIDVRERSALKIAPWLDRGDEW